MHWVDREPEPLGLREIRIRYTPGWVQHYRDGVGTRPNDKRWLDFHDHLKRVFCGICAYCERSDKGQTDHFRPKSTYPDLVYEWSNWLFSCATCNSAKGGKWPQFGYVDPCASLETERPEHYFDFDLVTGEIVDKEGLSGEALQKASDTKEHLRLNDWFHVRDRRQLIYFLSELLPKAAGNPVFEEQLRRFIRVVQTKTNRDHQLSSVTRKWISEQGHAI